MEIREPYCETVGGDEPFCVYTPAADKESSPSIAIKMRFTGEDDAALARHELEVFVGTKSTKNSKERVEKITPSWWHWRTKPLTTNAEGWVSFVYKFRDDPTKHYFLVHIAGAVFRIGVMEAGQSNAVLTSVMPAISDDPSHDHVPPPPTGPGRVERKSTQPFAIFPPDREPSGASLPMQTIDSDGQPRPINAEEPELPALPTPKPRHTVTLTSIPALPPVNRRNKPSSPEEFDRQQQQLETVIVRLLAELKQAGKESAKLSSRFGSLEREYIEATAAFLDQAVLSTETVVEFEDAALKHLAKARALLNDTKNTTADTAEQAKREIAAMIEAFRNEVSAHRLARLARFAQPIVGRLGLNGSANAVIVVGVTTVAAFVWFVWTILPK